MKRVLAVLLLSSSFVIVAAPTPASDDDAVDLTVHEWGTFTSVAGSDGLAVGWTPAGGPVDLPCFVDSIVGQIKYRTRGRIRMETPVLYFYTPREVTLDVAVAFPGGMITEWYPSSEPVRTPLLQDSGIRWTGVAVRPGAPEAFPVEDDGSHYYAARKTGAAPLFVNGQTEKMLFYRGVGDFSPSIAAKLDGGRVRVRNLTDARIPSIVLFQNARGRIGYRLYGDLDDEATLSMPSFGADVRRLHDLLVRLLVDQGLYQKEAHAMVETWRDSWFEEGARVFYIVPPERVDTLLPLTIDPEPQRIERVFVGRMELVTPSFLDEVEVAVRYGNDASLAWQGRFLEPAIDELARLGRLDDAEQRRGREVLGRLGSVYADAASCR